MFDVAFDDAPARLGDSTQPFLLGSVPAFEVGGPERVQLRVLLVVQFAVGAFESDDSLDEDDIENWLNEGRKGTNGELNDEEDAQLNPLRTAYLEGILSPRSRLTCLYSCRDAVPTRIALHCPPGARSPFLLGSVPANEGSR
jgi:hypothetical protein